ncbi:MAG: HNH endonuclease signature motif containing protein [Alphaproteobacteria bacterium]|nr:HNH endonuclease signature motif containing protein [Alphaproteobacteria bacterium]
MVHFTLQDPERTRALRRDFDHRDMNRKFVKWLYRKGYLDKYKDVISLERARRGRIPRGFDVHHIVPLSGGGTNHVSNLCLIERSLHKFINKKCFDPALRDVKIGESADIDVPDFGRVALRREYAAWADAKTAQARRSPR